MTHADGSRPTRRTAGIRSRARPSGARRSTSRWFSSAAKVCGCGIPREKNIWTAIHPSGRNIHGHAHPVVHAAIREQLEKSSHLSFLGFTHPLAAELAEKLCGFFPPQTLERVFFSDDGSTAIECALKMALQYRQQSGEPQRTRFIAFADGYHGDTLGAASLGGVGRFFDRFRSQGYECGHVRTSEELRGSGTRNPSPRW